MDSPISNAANSASPSREVIWLNGRITDVSAIEVGDVRHDRPASRPDARGEPLLYLLGERDELLHRVDREVEDARPAPDAGQADGD